jgi:serine/threonine-protein kinase
MDETQALGGNRRMVGDRYELRGLIGQGGMADVELGYDTQLDRQVAVKILHGRYANDPSFVARFRREAQAAASMNHPNVVGVYDTGESDGRPFIVMEYVQGRSLKEILQSDGLLPERAAEIAGDAALALHYASSRGLVHRDIKPGNIMVDNEGKVKVTDFGIARAVNAETVTQTAAVFGTAAYVAPEQAQGEKVDGRTDIYALGCCLYEMLTGRQPFQADSAVALAYQHVSATPVPPSQVNPEIAPELESVVLRAMAKNPDDRYADGREMHADLQRAIAGLPVAAPAIIAYEQTQALDRTQVAAPVAEPYYEQREERYYPEEEPRGRGGLIALLTLLVLAILGLGFFLLSGFFDTEPVAQVTIPPLEGRDVIEAQNELLALELEVRLEDVENPDLEPRTVIETDPPAGEAVDVGTLVTVRFAVGPDTVEVPPVDGRPEAEAEALLREANLSIGPRIPEASDDVAEGVVIRAEPAAGTALEPGTEVSLVVSSGEPLVVIPEVEGLTQARATSDMVGACANEPCLEVVVTEEFSATVDEGRVIRQMPAAGQEVPRGSPVGIVISLGPEPVATPTPTPPPPPPTPTPVPPPSPSPSPSPSPAPIPPLPTGDPTAEPTP